MKKLITFLMLTISVSLLAQDNFNQNNFSDLQFRNVGPTRGGRVTTVAGIESQPSVFYMGATGGGVWKTEDSGSNWSNVSDGYFSTGSIGAINVFQQNPEIVYVGTGSDGIRSNVIIGKGIYRSDDGASSWKFLGLKEAGQIGSVEIDPANPDKVFVAAIGNPFGPNEERGVFRTLDGGDNWEKVLFISENCGACDIEFAPDNSMTIYASVWTVRRKPWTILSGSVDDGVYRSTDGGENWTKLSNGLPEGLVGKSDLAVCKSDPKLLYVLIEAENNQGGVYISEDRGDSFKKVDNERSLIDRPFYYTNIDVDPTNPDKIYVNTTGFHLSTDRGKSWSRRSTPHGDNHDMWINPSDPDIFIQSNDGGANITLDGGNTWSTQNNQPTSELYQVNLDDQFVYWLYAGQQDNSTVAIPSQTRSRSRSAGQFIMDVGGCETGPAIPKPGNHNIVYSNCKGRFGRFSKITGVEKQYYVGAINMYGHNPGDLKYRFQRVSPILVSPHDPDLVYHASQYLHATRDEGVTWETISPDLTAFEPDKQVISGAPITRDITGEEFYSTIYAIAESPLEKGVIWTGANDGPVYVTRNGGESWANVTPPDLPPGGRVQTIDPSPHNPAKAYVAVYRYLLNDWQPYIYKTEDYGQTWQRITDGTNGIPIDWPTRVVRESPDKEGMLFAGTEFGMFISLDDGEKWDLFQFNLPVVPVTDIKIYRNDLVLSTMGRSFWIMDNISALNNLQKIESGNSTTLFDPRDAYRSAMTRGAQIDFFLAEVPSEISLNIIDPSGSTVRVFKYSSSENDESTQDETKTSDSLESYDPLIPKKGLNRIEWDLTTYGPSRRPGGRPSRGPRIIPARYRLSMNVDGNVYESAIEVLPDPALIADGLNYNDFKEQYQLSIEVSNLINEIGSFRQGIDNRLELINEKVDSGKKLSRGESKEMENLTSILDQVVTDDGPYPQPMLSDQANYLYSMITSADQKPGKDAYDRLEELRQWFDREKKKHDLLK